MPLEYSFPERRVEGNKHRWGRWGPNDVTYEQVYYR